MGRNAEKYKKLIEDMSIHAQAEYPREACGIVTTDFTYIPCKNLSPSPKDSFILDPVAILEYEDVLWGIVHSHPDSNPLPSEEDIKHTVFDEYKFFVGFAGTYYTYWYDKNLNTLRYEPFEEYHLNANNGTFTQDI